MLPGVSEALRRDLGLAGVRAAQAVGYVGAGTVEFILDPQTLNFHFMEMNTRLQVEHPVTEMITGTDLVEWQIKVASGERLPVKQEQLAVQGHAFEARIYAESPEAAFMPGAGPLLHLLTPQPDPTVRIETGVQQGDEVSVHYDPMIAKLVVWSEDRISALEKLHRKLSDYQVVGLDTNLKFLMRLSQHPQFVEGRVHTGFIEEHTEMLLGEQAVPQSAIVQAIVGIVLHDESIALNAARTSNDPFNPFATLTGFRVNHLYERKIELWHRNKEYKADVVYNRDGTYTVRVEGAAAPVEVSAKLTRPGAGLVLVLEMDKQNVLRSGVVMQGPHTIHLFTLDGSYKFSLPVYDNSVEGNNEVSDSLVVSPMPGVVDKVMVKEGDSVRVGDPLFVVIAMKMEHVIKSPKVGIIDRVLFQSGENVSKNVALVQWKD
ncbi:hypothetical protein J6590_004879 [Homalodisca vitripennis]|nr:hypothetical protein J6590_004879 [Homalodisca vitripennis]